MAAEQPELFVPDTTAWRRWLDQHHTQPDGVWLVLAKKGTTDPTSLSYDRALEEALCYGWIDGQAGRRDEATYKQRFTPRRRRVPRVPSKPSSKGGSASGKTRSSVGRPPG